jgi:hypothetical protein
MLPTLEEIRAALDARFAPLEPKLAGYRLRPPGLPAEGVARVESALGVRLPEAFRALVSAYDFGSLTIGATAFGFEADYAAELVDGNTAPDLAWWGDGARPAQRVAVAHADEHAVLLDCDTGAVLVLTHGDPPARAVAVARDFEAWFRGIGTLAVRPEVDRDALADAVGAPPEGRACWRA